MGTDPLMNLHTHTIYSDGAFVPEEIVQRAFSGGLRHIAITDHFETCKVENPLCKEDFPRYLRDLRELKATYHGRINVLAGVEIDTNPERCDLHDLPFDMMNQLDLVLFEYANDPQNGGVGLDELFEVRKRLNVPCGLCHWDMDRIFPDARPEDLADRLERMDIFVEISTSDFYRRNGRSFFDLGERFFKAFKGKVRLSIGTDSHRRIDEVVNIGKGQAFVRRLELNDQMLFQ